MISYSKYIVKFFCVLAFVSLISVTNAYSQAPDCDICDQILEDGDPGDPQTLIEYAQCVEENCDGSIPVDTHIWLVMLGGVAMVYFYYLKKNKDNAAAVV